MVSFIREDLGQVQWSEDEIQRLVGLVRTNAAQVRATGVAPGEERLDDDELGTARVLYPSLAPMSVASTSCLLYTSPSPRD